MSQRVTLDDAEMRARLRPLGHAARPAAYVARPAAEPSRKLFQDVKAVDDFKLPQAFSQPIPIQQPTVAPTYPPLTATELTLLVNQPAKVSVLTPSVPDRQIFSTVPHKPDPSIVLKRELFTPKPAELVQELQPTAIAVTPRPEVHRTFDPPAKVRRIKLLRLTNGSKFVLLRLQRGVMALPVRQRALTGLAALVLVVGSSISISQLHSNQLGGIGAAKASIAAAVPATTTGSTTTAPSTAQVTADTLRSYQVAPDAARYIRIGKFGVIARVLQVGVTKSGALATPSNVYDAAWYDASAKPGQPGATLIDGHVSSWTTNGVFYDIKNLGAGDNIEIERGDGTKLEYSVVKTMKYPKDGVDMKALMKPVTAGKSGLNLITCGGKYDSKAGEFTERVAVYATLDN